MSFATSQLVFLAVAVLLLGAAGYRFWAQRRARRAERTGNLSVHQALKLTKTQVRVN